MIRIYDRKKEKGQFYRIPMDLRIYVDLPEYKAEMSVLYGIIADYYNPAYGYAFPSITRLAIDYGKTAHTTSKHLAVLEKYELIAKRRTQSGNHYLPLIPLSTEDFYAKYPAARDARTEAENKLEKGLDRWAEYRQTTGIPL